MQIHSLSGATLSLIRVCVESLERLRRLILYFSPARGTDYLPSKSVTIFVTRQDRNGKERTGMHRLDGALQDLGIAQKIGETVAIASFFRNGHLSLLISGP